jgi:beta-phosphoglucomutase family hydrolase
MEEMKLELPEGNFKAYLFDCDGTIVDSMPLHYVAWKRVLGEQGCAFSEELFYAWGGMPIRAIIAALNEEQGLSMPVEETARNKERYYTEMIEDLKAIPEVLAHIEDQHGKIPFAVVSGSTRDSVETSLGALGLLGRFDTLVCAGDYAKGKPDPEPFLTAARRLGVKPEECLVFEDAETGVAAAKAAGMAVVKVPLPHERKAQEAISNR